MRIPFNGVSFLSQKICTMISFGKSMEDEGFLKKLKEQLAIKKLEHYKGELKRNYHLEH